MMNNKQEVPDGIKVKSLYKAIQLLFQFPSEDRDLGVTELAERCGLPKSSVHNILSTFEECGIVKRNPNTNKFHLGVKVLELSNHFYRNNDVRQIMKPYMIQIANEVEECVYLAILQDTEIVYVDAAFPDSVTGGRNMTGIKAPAYCTGIGKALLAFEPETTVNKVVEEGFHGFTPYTILDGESLRLELETIRNQGYAIDNMEHEYGVKCVAAPIRNQEGKVVAAYSISGPSPRFGDDRIPKLADLLIRNVDSVKNQLQ